MFSNPAKKLTADIAKATGVDVNDVSKVLAETANQAYANVSAGFVLPGFGTFRIVRGEGNTVAHPFTGEPVTFGAPPAVEFIIDTAAQKSFLAGTAESNESTPVNNRTARIAPVALLPDAQDMLNAGIEPEPSYRCKIGGEPDWIQAPEIPVCCGDSMLFYGQLDSLDRSDYCIGDVGMLYVFFCRSCCATRSILQF